MSAAFWIVLALTTIAYAEAFVIIYLRERIAQEREMAATYRDGYERECEFSDRWRDEAFRARGLTPPTTEDAEARP